MDVTVKDDNAVAEPINNGYLPLVSVIIPTYNFGHLIGFTLDSLLAQTYTNWECIVVDDGSKDNTAELMAKYTALDKRIQYHRQPNGGPAKARNKGIDLAKGQYLQFLDADDLLQPNKLKWQVNAIINDTDIDVVYAPTMGFYTSKANPGEVGALKPDISLRPLVGGKGDVVIETFLKTTIFPSASIIRLSLVRELHRLDENLIQAEDWDLYLRAAQKGATFKYLANAPEGTKALIRKHDSNNTLDFFRLQYYVVLMRKKFAQSCNNVELLQLNRQLMLKNLEDLIFEIQYDLERGNRKRAIKRSFKALGIHPTLRYFIYAVASLFVPASLYKKITQFSFSKLLKA